MTRKRRNNPRAASGRSHFKSHASIGYVGWVRGPPVRMSPAQSRFEIKRSGETAVRAEHVLLLSGAECRSVAAVKGEDMRAGGPRTQDFHPQNAIALRAASGIFKARSGVRGQYPRASRGYSRLRGRRRCGHRRMSAQTASAH
jgi:hypothetical protein